MNTIAIKRIYEASSQNDGYRILIDRIWPRGISKQQAKLDEWNKQVAPSTELRKWFAHKEERFEEFARRYKTELSAIPDELEHIIDIAKKERVCLLYGAKNEACNQAVVLQQLLNKKMAGRS